MSTDARVTIHDVAAAAGVSRQTVSRAMNDMAGISEATKARVLDAALQLGYRPSRFGRGLVLRDHRSLGLVIDNLLNPFYPELASAVVSRATAEGWTVVLLDCSGADDQRTMISQMADQVDALIGYLRLESADLDRIAPGVPVVRINPDAAGDLSAVEFELGRGMTALTDHLLAQGVRRPVMVDCTAADEVSGRARTFVASMRRRAIDVPVLHAGGDQLEHGIVAGGQILANLPRTDAIMCFNDITAFGVLKAVRQHREVPTDIRVIGVDGLVAGTYVTPQLTSLAVDMTEVASAAVELVLSLLDGRVQPGSRASRRRVRHRLVIRESA